MLSRSVAMNILGGFGELAVGFATSLMLADWLGAADRGLLGILLTASNLAYVLAGLGLPLAVAYFSSRAEISGQALLGDTLLYGVFLAVVFVPGTWLLVGPLSRLLAGGRGGNAWLVAGVLVPVTFIAWTTSNQLLGQLRFGLYNSLSVLSRVATLVLVVVLVGLLKLGVTGAVLATMAASVLIVVGALSVILRGGAPRLELELFRKLLRYGSRIQLGALLQTVNYRLDVLVLGLFAPLTQVGYYFVAEFLAELVVTVASAFQVSVIPLVSRYEGDERQDRTTIDAIRHHTILASAATVGNALFSPLLILFALNHDYRPGLVPFFVLLPSMVPLGTATVVQGDLRGRGRPGLASVYGGTAAAVTVVLDFSLIPFFGADGAAVASVIAYTTFAAISLRGLSRLTSIPVRELVVPTRADFAAYVTAARNLLRRGAAPSSPAA